MGAQGVKFAASASGDIVQPWGVQIAEAGFYPVKFIYTGTFSDIRLEVFTLNNTLATPDTVDVLPFAFRNSPHAGANMALPANGLIAGFIFVGGYTGVGAGNTVVNPISVNTIMQISRSTAGALSATGSNGYSFVVSLAFGKAP
jgi:hypothetical protein